MACGGEYSFAFHKSCSTAKFAAVNGRYPPKSSVLDVEKIARFGRPKSASERFGRYRLMSHNPRRLIINLLNELRLVIA